MSEVSGKVVIITGASSGLGEATAKMLAEKGAKLVLGARREDRLKKLVTDHISHKDSKQMAEDMYDDAIDADAIARAVTFAIEQPGEVDINEMIIRPTSQEL